MEQKRYVPDTMPVWPVAVLLPICIVIVAIVDGGGLGWFFHGIARFVGRIVLGF